MAGISTKLGKVLGAALGVALIAGSAAGLHARGASANAMLSLAPVPGAASYGSGVVGVAPAGGALSVTVSLNGARPGATYQVSACINVGTLQCTNNGPADFVAANGGGALSGSVIVPSPSRLDAVTLVNIVDGRDQYQSFTTYPVVPAITAPAVVSYGYPYATSVYPYGSVTAVRTPAGIVFVPYGAAVTPAAVCPAGFVGALGVVNGYYGYTYGSFYPYYVVNGLPVGLTTSVYCGIA
jgi:hypothetical protein